jgi:hypothetical protein
VVRVVCGVCRRHAAELHRGAGHAGRPAAGGEAGRSGVGASGLRRHQGARQGRLHRERHHLRQHRCLFTLFHLQF